MTAKEYLSRLQILDIDINQKIDELTNLRSMAAVIGSFDYSRERVQSSPGSEAPYTGTIEKITDMQDEINAEIDKFADMKQKIIFQIQGMENKDYVQLLYKRYVQGKPLKEIADEMNYTYTHVRHLHGWALLEFDRKYLQT